MAFLCSLLLLLSAFLLFSIQPMVAKMLLPILGGSPSVWNTAMVFYQATLLGGYFYSHVVSKKLAFKNQVKVHLVLLVLPAIVLPLYYGDLHPSGTGNPIGWMLGVMALSVGLPFFVLSASSPLIQSWFSRAGYKDPYFLYAASNIGSFLGLLSYPFFIEPRLTAQQQSTFWTIGYLGLAVLFAFTALKLRGKVLAMPAETETEPEEKLSWSRRLKWLFLAFVPSSQFIGVTTYLTTDIAVMPLLWVIPLAIYLLTMVFVFAKKPPIPHKLIVAAFPFLMAGLIFMTAVKITKTSSILYALTATNAAAFTGHLLMLFIGAMLCHGELAKDRPSTGRLTEFFLCMSFGGVLGGMFNALIAPNIFVQVIEYTLVLTVLCLALPSRAPGWRPSLVALDFAVPVMIGAGTFGLLWWQENHGMLSRQTYVPLLTAIGCLACVICAARPLRFALAIGSMILIGVYNHQTVRKTIFAGRSFFGVQRVESIGSKKTGVTHSLLNGRILHGKQIFRPDLENMPIAYYHPEGPLKEVFGTYPRPADAKVAVVGLGVGNTSLWSKKGEKWTFFEIDDLCEKLARDTSLFTCLANAQAKPDVIIGDARLRLNDVPDRTYDILLIDAFSGDSIPAHLMTVEAYQLYRRKLKPNGLLAVHISNRYLDLEPLVSAIATSLEMKSLICHEADAEETKHEARVRAKWCVVGPRSLDWAVFEEGGRWQPTRKDRNIVAWTDEFSSLLPLMQWK